MTRDELLRRISALPPEVDIGVQVGDAHLDIADVVRWGDGTFVALRCHAGDLRDLLREWGVPGGEGDRGGQRTARVGQR